MPNSKDSVTLNVCSGWKNTRPPYYCNLWVFSKTSVHHIDVDMDILEFKRKVQPTFPSYECNKYFLSHIWNDTVVSHLKVETLHQSRRTSGQSSRDLVEQPMKELHELKLNKQQKNNETSFHSHTIMRVTTRKKQRFKANEKWRIIVDVLLPE